MTEYDTPDLDSLAELIAQSSFGVLPPGVHDGPDLEFDEEQSDDAIHLRERIRQCDRREPWWGSQFPEGSWHGDLDTTAVFDEVGTVFPEADGSFECEFNWSSGSRLYARDDNARVLALRSAGDRLSRGAERCWWRLLVAQDRACRSTLTFSIDGWSVDAAIRWRLERPETALAAGLTEVTSMLVARALGECGGASELIGERESDHLSLQLSIEQSLGRILAEGGLASECAVRVRRAVGASSTGGSDFGTRAGISEDWVRAAPPKPPAKPLVRHLDEARRLGEAMKQIAAAGDRRELPARLRRAVRRLHFPYDKEVFDGMAVLYECLRVEYGLDSIEAEDTLLKMVARTVADEVSLDGPGTLLLSKYLDFLTDVAMQYLPDIVAVPNRDAIARPRAAGPGSTESRVIELVNKGIAVRDIGEELGLPPDVVREIARSERERRHSDRFEPADF